MEPHYSKIHVKFKLDAVSYTKARLTDLAYCYIKEGLQYQKEIGLFLQDWLDANNYIFVQTSGSTGVPKKIKIYKQAMVNSAIATGDFFNLKPGDSILHCLPSKYIAGKMMFVRALILGLDLKVIEPTIYPNINTVKHYNFCAFIPMQLQNSLDKLQNITTIIVGGGRVSNTLRNKISTLKPNIYETYGMTETVTHIAVKQINNIAPVTKQYLFKTLPHVSISIDNRSCLVIDAPKILKEKIITNDIVKLHSKKTFSWLGRFDHVINTGGVKVYPETIEEKLQEKIDHRFFITSLDDDTLGQRVILVIEGETFNVEQAIFKALEKYEKPKQIFFVKAFKETDTGKVNRNQTLKAII